jgi:Flp pilus assembly protein TadD
VWPAKLVFARYTARPEGQIASAAPWVLLTLWFAVSCLGIWRRRWYGFVGAWFFMILAPSSSIYPQMMCNYYQEHRMYLSLAAVILLGVLGGWWVVHHLAQHVGAQWRVHALALACMAALTGVCVVATRVRVTDYHSVLAMTLSRVRAQPEGRHHWRELAAVHWHEGRPSNTLAALRQGTTCVPEPVGLYMQLGAYCMELGLTQDALQAYVAGADVCTNRAPLLQEAGHVALQAECYETARDHFEAARACRGDDVKTLIGLRAAYAALGEHAQAERFNRLALHAMLTNMPGHVRQNMGAPIQEHNEQP